LQGFTDVDLLSADLVPHRYSLLLEANIHLAQRAITKSTYMRTITFD